MYLPGSFLEVPKIHRTFETLIRKYRYVSIADIRHKTAKCVSAGQSIMMSCRQCYKEHAKCVRPMAGAACERCNRKNRRCMRRLNSKYKKYKRRRGEKSAKRKRNADESGQPSSLQKKPKLTVCALQETDDFFSISEPLSQSDDVLFAGNSPSTPSEKKVKPSEDSVANCILDALL